VGSCTSSTRFRHLQFSLNRLVKLSCDETPGEVCKLSLRVMFQLVFPALHRDIRFLPILYPHRRRPSSRSAFLTEVGDDTGLPRSAQMTGSV
jgi:hypothetical protein